MDQDRALQAANATNADLRAKHEEEERKRKEKEATEQAKQARLAKRLTEGRTCTQYLEAGELEQGFEYLIKALRADSDNQVARNRLISMLVHRPHALPLWRASILGGFRRFEFAPNGTSVACVTDEGKASVYHPDGRQINCEAGDEPVLALCYAPHSKLVAGLTAQRVFVWAAASGQVLLSTPVGRAKCMDVRADGRVAAVVLEDGTVKFVPLTPGRKVSADMLPSRPPNTLRFVRDVSTLLLGDQQSVTLRDSGTGKIIKEWKGPFQEGTRFEFATDGSWWCHTSEGYDKQHASRYTDLLVYLTDNDNKEFLIQRFWTWKENLKFATSHNTIVATSPRGEGCVLNIRPTEPSLRSRRLFTPPPTSINIARPLGTVPANDALLVVSQELEPPFGALRLFDIETGQQLSMPLRTGDGSVHTRAGSNAPLLATGTLNGFVVCRLTSARHGHLPPATTIPPALPRRSQVSRDGKKLLRETELRRRWVLVDPESGQQTRTYEPRLSDDDRKLVDEFSKGHSRDLPILPRVSVALSGDGRFVVTAAGGDPALVWSTDPRHMETLHALGTRDSVSFVSKIHIPRQTDQAVLVYERTDSWNSITGEPEALWYRVFSLSDGKALTDLTRLDRDERILDVSPDGTWMLVKDKRSVYLRGIVGPYRRTDRLVLGGTVVAGAFSPNGRTFVVSARDGTARVGDTETGLPVSEVLVFDPRPKPVSRDSRDEDDYLTRLQAHPPRYLGAARVVLAQPKMNQDDEYKSVTPTLVDVSYDLDAEETKLLISFALAYYGFDSSDGRFKRVATPTREELRGRFGRDLRPGRDIARLMTWLLADPDKRASTPLSD